MTTRDPSEWFELEFDRAVSEIDMQSTPGDCVLARFGSTNAQVFGWDGIAYNSERYDYVRAVVLHRYQSLLNGDAVCDPIRLFIKPEPHKRTKLDQGRYRLISAVSLVDTLLDRILCGWLLRAALKNVGRTPCLLGWTPIKGGWRYIYQRYGGKPVLCLDRSSWDWTVQPWLVRSWLRFLIEMASEPSQWWIDVLTLRFKLLFEDPLFSVRTGEQFKIGLNGVMKSGCFYTLLLNSVSQSILHYIAAERLGLDPVRGQPSCMGDDTVQESLADVQDYVRQLELLGAIVKGSKIRNWVEFCGFAFANDTCIPVYWQKHLFALAHGRVQDKITSYQMIYANEPRMFQFLRRVALEVEPELVMSSEEAKEIMNG